MQNKIRIIGITGITGSGTSTVAKILQELGAFVISADKLAHEVIKKGQRAYEKIIETFGTSFLMPDDEINRKQLGDVVFGAENKEKRASLESIIHPVVLEEIDELVKNAANTFVVIDAPLLVESGLDEKCDEVWLVTADDEERISRIIKRDGVDRSIAEKRIKSRQNEENLKSRADVVIINSGDILSLQKQVKLSCETVHKAIGICGLFMQTIFRCPTCLSPMSLPSCSCGHTVSSSGRVYQLTNDPYMVKDDAADVKYIGYEDINEKP